MTATRGLAIGGPHPVIVDLARDAERRGFDAVWVSETTSDSIVAATVLAQHTDRIRIGTNVTLAFPRSPTITAMGDLNELSGDRFVVGLGSQVRRIIEERFSAAFDQPAARMAEYVQAMRTVWRQRRGEDVTFDGDIYRVLRGPLGGASPAAGRPMPEVYVAAVGPVMTATAATHADGWLGHPFTSLKFLDLQRPRIDEALAAAGRPRDSFTVCTSLIVCISDDRDTAVREAKGQIAFYGTTPNYRRVLGSGGDGHLTGDLRRVWATTGHDLDALIAAVPDDVVERYAVAGTPDEVRDRLDAYAERVDHVILGGAWYRVPTGRISENLSAIIDTFGRS
ncbi:MAG: LLM class flavin-dependent oxidoreductase [Actinomycetota bacterium]|nr:LLM class flavin-dependent oxidoreductase [Actinomycetota bacterium]